MEYNTSNVFTCKICGKVIPCVFDGEHEIIVPKVEEKMIANSPAKTIRDEKNGNNSNKEMIPKSVLIYLSCPDFHGPFAYSISIKDPS
jgi:hypothetical protein